MMVDGKKTMLKEGSWGSVWLHASLLWMCWLLHAYLSLRAYIHLHTCNKNSNNPVHSCLRHAILPETLHYQHIIFPQANIKVLLLYTKVQSYTLCVGSMHIRTYVYTYVTEVHKKIQKVPFFRCHCTISNIIFPTTNIKVFTLSKGCTHTHWCMVCTVEPL